MPDTRMTVCSWTGRLHAWAEHCCIQLRLWQPGCQTLPFFGERHETTSAGASSGSLCASLLSISPAHSYAGSCTDTPGAGSLAF